MFKKQMIDDCRRIFGFKKIIFGTVDEGIEQGALYIDVEDVRERVHDGKYFYSVTCRLGCLGSKEGNKYGYLLGQLKQASKKEDLAVAVSRFLVYGKERDVKFLDYEGFMTQTELSVKYSVAVDYDPPEKTKGFVSKIKEYLKK